MAVDNSNTPAKKTGGMKRESLGSALMQIGIAAVILAIAVFFVWQRGDRRKKVADGLKEAREVVVRDNPKELNEALEVLDGVLKVDANAADALAMAADIHTELWLTHKIPGSDGKAREYLKKAEDANSRSEDRYATRALHTFAEGNAKGAEEYAEDLRRQGASSAKLWYALGKSFFAQGNLALAKQAMNQAADKAWKNPRFSSSAGETLLEEGSYDAAYEHFQKGSNSNPEHFRARLGMALARLYKGTRQMEAAEIVKEILGREAELSPGLKARLYAAQAEIFNAAGAPDEAVKAADSALALNPEDQFALFARARALGLKKDPGALEALQKVVALRKTSSAFYFEGAKLLVEGGNHDAALALLNKYEETFRSVTIASLDGTNTPAIDKDDKYWIARGDILKAAEKVDEAMVAYEKAISADSINLIKAHYAKGALFLHKKDYDKAIETLTVISPDDGTGTLADAYLALGDSLFAKKDYAKACQQYGFALTKLRSQSQPKERLVGIVADVSKRLAAAGQRPMAKLWEEEAKPIIQ